MNWKDRAIQLLSDSLYPIPQELNEIDWKSDLSPKTDRLAQHICAFANLKGGGVLVFGVKDDGSLISMNKEKVQQIVQRLGTIAENSLSVSIRLEHAVLEYQGHPLLFVFIPEQKDRPVHMRGSDIYNAYTRSAGMTVKMSPLMVKSMIAESAGISFEQSTAISGLTGDAVLSFLNYKKFYEMLDKKVPETQDSILSRLEEFDFCFRDDNDSWSITNLGALLFANSIKSFPKLMNRRVIVRKYLGPNNRQQASVTYGAYGYAVGFEGLVDYVMKNTSTEQIDVLREPIPTYPKVAIREFIANALVHQDFSVEGMDIAIEIFSNRLAITNPGAPLNDINRLMNLPPQSRNEKLAQTLFLLGICERRGSGIDRAVEAIESMGLPAVEMTKGEHHTKVVLYPKKNVNEMTKQEKINACYQHACLLYEDNKAMNNQSVRERFKLDKSKSSVASRIIADTLDSHLIKVANADIMSKKYATYVPFYA